MFTRHFAHWPPNVSKSLAVPATTLCYNLDVSATRYPDKSAIVYYGQHISFAQLRQQVEALAGYLSAVCKVGPGDRVILNCQNSPQFVIGYYAILRANAVVVPANAMLKQDELRYLVQDSGAVAAIFGQEILSEWLPLLNDGTLGHAIVATYGD